MQTVIRSIVVSLFGAGLMWSSAQAVADSQPPPPDQVAKQTIDKVLTEIQQHRGDYQKNPDGLYKMIDRVLIPHLDIAYISKLVLGQHWRQASPDQRKRFQAAFKQLLIQTYGNALYGFNKNDITYEPLRAHKGAKDVTFRAVVKSDNGQKTPVNLDMHFVDGAWKVYNGSVGNLSFVTSYRGQFNAQIQGGGLDTLIKKMENRYGTGQGSSGS